MSRTQYVCVVTLACLIFMGAFTIYLKNRCTADNYPKLSEVVYVEFEET